MFYIILFMTTVIKMAKLKMSTLKRQFKTFLIKLAYSSINHNTENDRWLYWTVPLCSRTVHIIPYYSLIHCYHWLCYLCPRSQKMYMISMFSKKNQLMWFQNLSSWVKVIQKGTVACYSMEDGYFKYFKIIVYTFLIFISNMAWQIRVDM